MGKTFEDLEVWRRSKALAVQVYRATSDCRDFAFRDQITRAALSIPSNVAEGAERNSPKEFIQFIGYAKGSSAELRTQLMIGAELKFLSADEAAALVDEATQISRMLFGLAQSLSSSAST